MSMPYISQLIIFPIKSLGPVALQQAEVDALGLVGDRRFMLVSDSGQFITQRTRPDLTRFTLKLYGDDFLIRDQISQTHRILATNPELGDWVDVSLWDDQIRVREVKDGISAWFSELLHESVRLVHIQPEAPRAIETKYQTSGSQQSSFADSLPILIASEASYQLVEQHLGTSFDWMRFRANVIIAGMEAFEEDTWAEFTLGEVRLFGAKPCARCQLINVEPATGEVDKSMLTALSTFRKVENKVYFGQQAVPISFGVIRVGDEIQVEKTKDALR
jgi:uncharacterized protein YcbX